MILILFLNIFLNLSFAETIGQQGVVVVLEAPILLEESLESKVIERKRRGEKVIIHREEISSSPYRYKYRETVIDGIHKDLSGNENNLDGFYRVTTKNGGEGFIPKKYVKVIYKDSREFASRVNRFPHDPTDYRLEEPLPEGYPLYDGDKPRGIFTFGVGATFKTNYAYPVEIDREDYGSRFGFNLIYLKNVKLDPYNRFYFGGMIHAYTEQVSFFLKGIGRGAEEKRGQIGIGPAISYDIWRRGDYKITTMGMIPVNFNRVIIGQTDFDDSFEERIFKGFSITPKIASLLQIKNIHPSLDFIIGAEIQFQLSHTLTSNSAEVANPTFWNENSDKLTYPTGATFAFLLGVQSNY